MKNSFDVIIIGGSYAGLSAAMSLGRSLRKVLIIDSGLPCNRQTPHSHNFITQDGETPAAIAAKALEQVLKYDTVSLIKDTVINAAEVKRIFEIKTLNGSRYTSKKLLIAAGIRDILPSIPGLKECWGISVIHCPYCHGYEFKGRKNGILINHEMIFHLVPMIKNLTAEVTVLTNGEIELSEEQTGLLAKSNVKLINQPIHNIIHENGSLTHIVFADGTVAALDALYVKAPFEQHTEAAAQLGCDFTEHGHVSVDNMQKTSVPGVFACGDCSSMMRSVATAVYTGNVAGAMINKELCEEEFSLFG
jgi:thioredoxin reductase